MGEENKIIYKVYMNRNGASKTACYIADTEDEALMKWRKKYSKAKGWTVNDIEAEAEFNGRQIVTLERIAEVEYDYDDEE